MIRVFVGCAPNHEDAESQAVLEWSIRKHASQPVDITWMKLSRDLESPFYSDPQAGRGWNTRNWATPFSGFRWALPELCRHEGRAIYCDSDFIFMADIAELWHQLMNEYQVLAKSQGWRFCLSLWNCESVYPEFDRSDPEQHKKMSAVPFTRGAFDGNWNCLDGENYKSLADPAIKAIHYTAMANQPHLRYAIPRLAREGRKHWFNGHIEPHWRKDLIELFDTLLEEAQQNGYPVARYCHDPVFGQYPKRDLTSYRGGRRAA